MKGNISDSNIKSFRKYLTTGKLIPYYKSQPLPDNKDATVKKIVGLNFDAEVMKSNKDILLKVYAPWCGHCKALAPIFEKVAQKLSINPNIVLAEVDITANEIPSIRVQSYPTIYFYRGSNRQSPIKYEGERTEE